MFTQYASRVNTTFLQTIADCNLEQLVDFPTRKDTTLNIILTTHPSFKQRCKPIPSIGSNDHDIVLLGMYSTARRPKPIRRKIHLWRQADTQGIKDDLTDLVDSVIVPDDIDTTWENIKRKITETIERRVPSKMTTSRYTKPWMNSVIKRAIRRKQRAYRKARLTKKKQDKDRY